MPRKERELDAFDRKLLQELARNSKRSYRRLARDLGMSPAAMIERVRSLEGKGYITGYGCRMDYLKLGFEFMAIVEINISAKDLIRVEEKISKIPHVAAVWDTAGDYDALAVLMCKSRGELSATIKKILATEGVESTSSNIILNVITRLTEFDEV
jgi:Lrp/AsnC family transcriptional regulator, leucine-responsive regulatory protein